MEFTTKLETMKNRIRILTKTRKMLVICMLLANVLLLLPIPAYPAANITTSFNSLIDIIDAGIKILGIILFFWGGATLFTGLSQHDNSSIKQGALTMIGGVACYFMKSIATGIGLTI